MAELTITVKEFENDGDFGAWDSTNTGVLEQAVEDVLDYNGFEHGSIIVEVKE